MKKRSVFILMLLVFVILLNARRYNDMYSNLSFDKEVINCLYLVK